MHHRTGKPKEAHGATFSRDAIANVLREVEGNKERAAELLGLSSTTLWRKMKRLDVTYES